MLFLCLSFPVMSQVCLSFICLHSYSCIHVTTGFLLPWSTLTVRSGTVSFSSANAITVGATPSAWSHSGLPAGLSVSTLGAVRGTPTAPAGVYFFSLIASYASGPSVLVDDLQVTIEGQR